jgi:hypothetical protein
MSNVTLCGRFNTSDSTAVLFSNPGCALWINFNGTAVSMRLKKKSQTAVLYIIVDDQVDINNRTRINLTSKTYSNITLVSGLAGGNHTLKVVMMTEYYSGAYYDSTYGTQGFSITGGTGLLSAPTLPSRFIEYYGDSGAAGWDCWHAYDAGTYTDGDGYFTFPQVAARAVGAYCHNNSQSSYGITTYASAGSLQDTYDRINPGEAAGGTNVWPFAVHPDICVIHAVSNDTGYNASYFSTRKPVIQQAWADFANKLRQKHPNAHIVIAESYAWASYEPAQYLQETVDSINAGGFGYDADTNVSGCLMPWCWGQQHCVPSEHAAFGNILANHFASVMSWSTPTYNSTSTLPDGTITPGQMTNAGLENKCVVVSGSYKIPDGFRPNGSVGKIYGDTTVSRSGSCSLKVIDERTATPWCNWATLASPGQVFTVSAYIKGSTNTTAKLKVEAKDRNQSTLSADEGTKNITTSWTQYTTQLTCPSNTMTLWVVLTCEGGNAVTAWFDDITISVA